MNLAFITPTAYLQKFASQGDVHLALAHLIKYDEQTGWMNEYARFYRRESEQGRRVILDNGLFEGAQPDPEALIQRARAIKAQVVFAPDVLYDSKGTIKAFKQFIKLKHEEGLVCDIAGVPQADNPADWWDCFQFMDLHSECALVGLSILSVPKAFGRVVGSTDTPITSARVHLIRQLYNFSDISGHRITPCHLLGLGESYEDIKTANELMSRDIISNDSSSCFVHGANAVRYEKDGTIPGGKNHTPLDFHLKPESFDDEITAREDDIQHNIDTAKEIAHDS